MNFTAFLEQRVQQADSLLCVGLDPRVATVGELRTVCHRIISETNDFAAAFKPNIAFFEAFGADGLSVLHDLIKQIPAQIPVILDAKRGDIADTAQSYATAAFDYLGAHALTVNPYLGGDALQPLLARPDKGVFVLCRTSNPGAGELQELSVAHARGVQPLYQVVAQHAQDWSSHGNVGLVVGATDPSALATVRSLTPELWLLAPGVGAQGGELAATVTAGLRADGQGLLINASRQIARAPSPRQAAQMLRDQINEIRRQPRPAQPSIRSTQPISPPSTAELASALVASGCVRFGAFTLKSGVISPIYIDLRRLVSQPAVLRLVARAYVALLQRLLFDRLAGIPYAALPIATAIALEMERPLIYPRREAKEYGTRATIEGDYGAGERVVVIDDLATTGETKIEALQKLTDVGLLAQDIVVLIDRQQGAGEMLAAAGYRLHAVVTLGALLEEWLRLATITPAQYAEVKALIQTP
jgi:uridine monophosphate synthetase